MPRIKPGASVWKARMLPLRYAPGGTIIYLASKSILYNCRALHYEFSDKKNFLCDICSKPFIDPSALSAHKKIHSTVRPFQCQECSRKFVTAAQLRVHMVRNEDHLNRFQSVILTFVPVLGYTHLYCFSCSFVFVMALAVLRGGAGGETSWVCQN